MAYIQRWLIPGQVIYTRIWGEISRKEITDQFMDFEVLYRTFYPELHTITNINGITNHLMLKDDIYCHSQYLSSTQNIGWTIVVSDNHPLTKLIALIADEYIHLNIKLLRSDFDALNFLRKAPEHLRWDKLDDSILTTPTL